jgi:hypothetical protein
MILQNISDLKKKALQIIHCQTADENRKIEFGLAINIHCKLVILL